MTHHGAGLRKLTKNRELVGQIARGWRDAELSDADIALCAYAEKLTLTPSALSAEDIDALRAVGFDDRSIHDACAIVAYFNFVTRIAEGLHVELEDYWDPEDIL